MNIWMKEIEINIRKTIIMKINEEKDKKNKRDGITIWLTTFFHFRQFTVANGLQGIILL